MSLYSISLFLHIVGALGIFAAIGLEWAGLANLRRATDTAQVREWVRLLLAAPRVVGGPAALLVLVSGIHMSATRLGAQGWILVALGGMVLIAALGGAIGGRRIPGIVRELQRVRPRIGHAAPAARRSRAHPFAAGQSLALPRHRVPDVEPPELGRGARGDGNRGGAGRRGLDAGPARRQAGGTGGEERAMRITIFGATSGIGAGAAPPVPGGGP